MVRKVLVKQSGKEIVLEECDATDEEQLQELIKRRPDLLPVEDLGMTGPPLVVGRETPLPSGAADLVAVARSGELLVIEFKTGPKNSDFRHALAQLLDYGSDLWSRVFEEFEASVPLRYFSSKHSEGTDSHGAKSLNEAARLAWPGIGDDELALIID